MAAAAPIVRKPRKITDKVVAAQTTQRAILNQAWAGAKATGRKKLSKADFDAARTQLGLPPPAAPGAAH